MTRQRLFGQAGLARIGRHIRKAREAIGMSQNEAALAAGLSPRTFRDLEAGRTNPSLATMAAVVSALGLRLDDLVETAKIEPTDCDYTPADDAASKDNLLTRTLAEPRMQARIVQLAEEGDTTRAHSDAASFTFVLSGSVAVDLDGEGVVLRQGDCLHAQPLVTGEWRARSAWTRLLVVAAIANSASRDGTAAR
jgi:transcriptional regulator with XRE-family HTH domain